jgi:hypothetical protein
VEQTDVEEAMRLLYEAKKTEDDDGEKKAVDPTSAIFKIFRQHAEENKKSVIKYIHLHIIHDNFSMCIS